MKDRPASSLADALALPIVMPSEGGTALLKAFAAKAGIPPPSPRLRADDVEVLRSSVLAGLGVSALPLWLIEEDLAAKRLVQLAPIALLPSLPIRAVFAGAQTPRRLSRAFAEAFAASLPPVLRPPHTPAL